MAVYGLTSLEEDFRNFIILKSRFIYTRGFLFMNQNARSSSHTLLYILYNHTHTQREPKSGFLSGLCFPHPTKMSVCFVFGGHHWDK